MTYLISYDLRNPKKDYSGLLSELKNSPGWCHHLDSTWLIATSDTAYQIYHRLAVYIDDTDSILIIKVTRDWSGWLPKEAWEWLDKYVEA